MENEITINGIKYIRKNDIPDLSKYDNWYDYNYCMNAVKQDGNALQFVEIQTKEICMEAVKENGNALQFVKIQTKEICIEAVKEDGDALRYVDNRIFE